MSDTTKILDDYRRIRPIQRELSSLTVMKVTKPAVVAEAMMLGLAKHGRIVFDSDEEVNALFDHLIHDGNGGPTTPLERLTDQEMDPFGMEAVSIRAALCKAGLNVWRFVERRPGLGWMVEDVWHQRPRLVIDKLLGEQTQLKDGVAVMRLVDMGEWCFSTGLQGIPFGTGNLDTLHNLLMASPLVEIAPADFHPENLTRAQNLLWSRSLLRAWLRPGSVKLVAIPLKVGPKGKGKARKRR